LGINHRIGIVILNYNTFADTIKLVEELQKQTLANDLQIIIVDNASPNNSFEKLKPLENKYSNVVVLQTEANLGYAKGNNFGLKYLEDNIKPEYVAILNNDIILPNDCFEKLIEKYSVLENPAIIAPKQLDVNNKAFLPYQMNSYLDDCLNLFYIFKLFHKRNALKFIDNTGLKAMKVDMIPGSFMFASFERFKEMGYFYPNTFLFVEERFIAVKAKKLNLYNYMLLDETYIHAHSKTINTAYNQVEKYKLLYKGWLEFTKVCRPYGKLKAAILKPLMILSLLEMQIVFHLKELLKN
jgi:GT2 family glycosyltransferase